MSKNPFISVIIPTFNRAMQVHSALGSVLAQSYRNFEVIVVDDGSTDETKKVVASLIMDHAKAGIQIRYFDQPNQGQSVARNRGTKEAKGEWIAFLDSDDLWLAEKLERQIEALRQYKGESWACITDARFVDDLGMDTTCFRRGGRDYEAKFGLDHQASNSLAKMRDPFCVSTLLVHAELAKRVGWFDASFKYAEDHDFLLRLSLATPICYVNSLLCTIDQSKSPEGSRCRPWDDIEVRLRGWQSVLEKWLKLDGQLPPDVRKIVVHNLQRVHSAWTNWYLEQEKYDSAVSSMREALGYEVTTKLITKWLMMQLSPVLTRKIAPRMRVSE
jgi:glycosyltransferase involved in cell wall biosynthesis